MPSSLIDTIKKIQDSQPAEIKIQLLDGSSEQLKCIYKESDSPHFFLVFPPKQLPTNINTTLSCLVVVKDEEKSITFQAGIEAIKGDRILEMLAQKPVDPTTMRAYYRADIRTPITASYEPGPEARVRAWTFDGDTLDLSGGGVLAIFPAEFPTKHQIHLHINLPDSDKDIDCTAHVIRMTRLRKERWQIALQFDDLSQKKRDVIVSCCLSEQRRQLRERIQIT